MRHPRTQYHVSVPSADIEQIIVASKPSTGRIVGTVVGLATDVAIAVATAKALRELEGFDGLGNMFSNWECSGTACF